MAKKKAKKKVKKDNKILPSLFIIALISSLIGNFVSTFFISLICIIAVSFAYSIIKVRSFDRKLVTQIKESGCIISFSVLTALIAAIILPYILFHNSFVNIFVIQYAYLFPVLLIYLASLYFYAALIKGIKLNYKRLIMYSLVLSIFVSVVISLFLIIGSNYIYNERAQLYNQKFDQVMSGLNTADLYKANYAIFREIKAYQDNFVEEATMQKNAFQNLDAGFCIQANCAKPIADRAYSLITIVVNIAVTQGTLMQADNELQYISSGGFKQNFTSLDEYKTYLKNKVDASNFTIAALSNQDKSTLNLLESELNYQDFIALIKMNNPQVSTDLRFVGSFFDTGSVFQTNSSLYNSLSYTIEHSIPFRELMRMMIKVSIYATQQSKNSDLFAEIYNNRNIDESTESKIIRDKIILDRIGG